MLRRNDEKRRPEERIRPGGEDGESAFRFPLSAFRSCNYRKLNLRPHRLPYPVLLRGFDHVAPVERIGRLEEFVGIIGDLEKPLLDFFFGDLWVIGRIVTPTFAVDHLLVREDRLTFGTPPLHAGVLIGETLTKHLGEDPLRPFVIDRQMRADLFAPVIAPAHRFVLRVVARDDLRHRLLWRYTTFDRKVFRWQAEGVPADRVITLIALLTLVTSHDVRDGVVHRVTDVDAGSTRVVKHAHRDVFGPVTHQIGRVDTCLVPDLSPFWLNVRRIVAVHTCHYNRYEPDGDQART